MSLFEASPIKYVLPLKVEDTVEYHAGGEVYVSVEYCLSKDINYSITQEFENLATGDRYITEPVTGLVLTLDSMKESPDSYRDGRYYCRTAHGIPKIIPPHIPTGRYRIYFTGHTDGSIRKNIIVHYYTNPFRIK